MRTLSAFPYVAATTKRRKSVPEPRGHHCQVVLTTLDSFQPSTRFSVPAHCPGIFHTARQRTFAPSYHGFGNSVRARCPAFFSYTSLHKSGCASYPGDVVTRFTLNLILLLSLAVFISGSLQASSQSPAGAARPGPPPGTSPTPSSAPANAQSQPKNKITAYTLPPDLYRKTRNPGSIGFASPLICFFYWLFVLWFIFHRR